MNYLSDLQEISNEKKLKQLVWAIESAKVEFKLILARCNFVTLRNSLIEKLQQICPTKITVIRLKDSTVNLYAAILNEVNTVTPVLMITGCESLRDLPLMLNSANQMREVFRKKFNFPIVLWINDEIHKQMIEVAPDIESWATTKNFLMEQQDLVRFINLTSAEWFGNNCYLYIDNYAILEIELESAQKYLFGDTHIVDLETKANLLSLLGWVKRVNSKIDSALENYQLAIEIWQQIDQENRQIKILSEIALCHYLKSLNTADINSIDWQITRRITLEYIDIVRNSQREDLINSFISRFGDILRELQDWENLKSFAEASLEIHEKHNQLVELARDYGFLAEVALAEKDWIKAEELVHKSRDILSAIPPTFAANGSRGGILHDLSLYQFILAQCQYNLGDLPAAIANLEVAEHIANLQDNSKLYLKIIIKLQQLYIQEKAYLKAYEIKQKQRSIEQQFGLRSFIGAGRLEARKQTGLAPLSHLSVYENTALEINASSRHLDVERLIERIGRPDYKLIVIYGQSGVGKSSLVNAGIVPALKQKAMGIQDNLPITISNYTNWAQTLQRLMREALQERKIKRIAGLIEQEDFNLEDSQSCLISFLAQLRENEQRYLRTILIFDQFEEFFFICPNPQERRDFFDFLGECMNVLSLKVILSLRVDYLHYLLECNHLSSMKIIGNDILSSKVLYELGNFTLDDAKSIIQCLTESTSFRLEPDLINQLVQDLAGEFAEVRPIELQVVGAQLQAENITTLAEYQQRGTKKELIQRYLNEVVNDCGEENQQVAELLLYLLTDEKGTRPLKTRSELVRDLQGLTQALTTKIKVNNQQLDLILEIFVKSGLVVLLHENPANRYQLVHDYLAAFIRQQEEPKLKDLMTELERERNQRKLSEIKALTNSSAAFFLLDQDFNALIEALKAGGNLRDTELITSDIWMQTVAVLQQAVYLKPHENKFRERNRLEKHNGYVYSASFSPDGKTIATSSADGTVKLWHIDGRERQTLQCHGRVYSASFSPDGKIIATSSSHGRVQIWSISGEQLESLQCHHGRVYHVCFSPDGQTFFTAGDDNKVKIWHISGQEIRTLLGHSGSVYSISLDPDGKMIATASADSTVKLWNLEGEEIRTFLGHSSSVNSVCFSPNGKIIATASTDKMVKLWDIGGRELKSLQGHSGYVYSISFSPDGKTVATTSDDGTAKLWSINGRELETLKGHSGYVYNLSFSPDGKTIATASSDSTVKLWQSSGKKLKTLRGHISSVLSVSFSPDGQRIATASFDRKVKLWDVNGQELIQLKGHSSWVLNISFSPDGQTIATASDDKTVKLWDINGRELKTLSGHLSYVYSVSFSSDGQTIATASDDKTVKLWDINGRELKTLCAHSNYIYNVKFSPDGKIMATASEDRTVKLWDISGQELKTLMGHSGSVYSIAFSPDGKIMATASEDRTVKLWDINGRELKTLRGHSSSVNCVSFSPNGEIIASASSDSTVKLWSLDGRELKTLIGHSSRVNSLSFSPDGQTLATGSADKTVILWNFHLSDLLAIGCQWLDNYLITHPELLEELKACQTPAILKEASLTLVAQGEELARNGDEKEAIAKFRKAKQWNPSLKFDHNL